MGKHSMEGTEEENPPVIETDENGDVTSISGELQ